MRNLTYNQKGAKLNYEVQITSMKLVKIRKIVNKKSSHHIVLTWRHKPDNHLHSS